MKIRHVHALLSLVAVLSVACSAGSGDPARGGSGNRSGGDAGISLGSGGSLGLGGGLNVTDCTSAAATTVSGTVYDPAGKLPLYNAVVYVPVPGSELPPITEGVSCEKCSGMGARAVAVALTDAAGHFVLEGVPDGSNIPLVIQVGKWRRQVSIDSVVACRDNPLTDPNLTRLPRNKAEGHMPKIAMVTGHSDAVECLLRKIGIDDAEFTTDAGDGRVNMYYGCPHSSGRYGANKFAAALGGAAFPQAATTLYANPAKLDTYDMVLLSCEGHGCDEEKLPYIANMKGYGDKGGRILFDHMHFRWFVKSDNDWESIGTFGTQDDFLPNTVFDVDTSFPKGNSFADWLVNVGASSTRGKLTIAEAQHSADEATPPISQQWVYGNGAVQYMTINTPVELAETDPDSQCGRLVHTDLHVSATSSSDQDTPFPGGCDTGDLSPEEKALAFILFDLSSCVQKEALAPEPPPIIR
jgi:hypothetical protein